MLNKYSRTKIIPSEDVSAVPEDDILNSGKMSESIFRYSPRECDLLYALWNGIDPQLAAQHLGLSRAALTIMMSRESIRYELEKYYRIAAMSTEEAAARLSELGRQ
jgi:hypothetical protein